MGSDVSMSHVFSQNVLAAITLVRGWAGDGGTRARARCELGFLFSVANTTLLGAGLGLKLLKQKA